MVALLQDPAPARRTSTGRPLRLVTAGAPAPATDRTIRPPELRVVVPPIASSGPGAMAMAAIVGVVIGLFVVVRVLQGAPSPESSTVPAVGSGAAEPVLAAGDRIIIAQPGDSLWTIATELAPGQDPRPVVAALMTANGGESVQIGQQIVIPSRLVG